MKKIKQLEPMEIEKRSFEIISHELSEMQITLPADQEMITKRVIHTSADFDYIPVSYTHLTLPTILRV